MTGPLYYAIITVLGRPDILFCITCFRMYKSLSYYGFKRRRPASRVSWLLSPCTRLPGARLSYAVKRQRSSTYTSDFEVPSIQQATH